jgi:ABC-type multidrug transport system ATPase subunit
MGGERPPTDPACVRTASGVLFDRVTKRFRQGRRTTVALAALTLSVKPGCIAALVGHNGSGKTTALRIASTLVTPTSGLCSIHGLDVLRRPQDVRRCTGVSLDPERSFYLRLTAWQNLFFFAGVLGLKRSEAHDAIRRIAAELDIERFLPKPARQLSRGALARLSVARACLSEPPVFLLDEPFASVDRRGRELLWAALRRRAKAGRTVLLTTHDPGVAGRSDVVERLGVA